MTNLPAPAKPAPAALAPSGFPEFFTIETCKVCNSDCVFCTKPQWPRHAPFMDDALFDKVCGEIAANAARVRQVCLNGTGEPLLDRQLAGRVRRLKSAGIPRVIITTNASLLDEPRARALLDAGLDEILFSFNGLDREKYERLRVGLKFGTVMENVLRFIRLRNELAAPAAIRMRMEAHPDFSPAEIRAWIDFWRARLGPRDNVYAKKMHAWGNQIENRFAPLPEVRSPCKVLWSTMNILSDGTVGLCCVDFLPARAMGDLRRQTIAEVWRGPEFARVRALHQSGRRDEVGLCRGCDIWSEQSKITMPESELGGAGLCQ